ncbi:MAG: 16S rRNA (cytosine(1402)-N(4))-methyltransferase RsmH [Alphaproteobacteria bacterium]
MTTRHTPVLFADVMDVLQPAVGKMMVDGTLGGAGHAKGLIEHGATVVGLDRDATALARVGEVAGLMKVHGNFRDLDDLLNGAGVGLVDGILLDLGYSSDQMDDAARGLSYQADGPLDMRLNPDQRLTAAEIVNRWDEKEIARVLWEFGEEPKSRQIAGRLVRQRKEQPLATTGQLMAVIEAVYPPRHQARSHPAARTFQALRIAVNGELDDLTTAIPHAVARLNVGGRLAIITFNSLEDKLVKRMFQALAADMLDNVGRVIGRAPFKVGKKIEPTDEEITTNRRARSAKIRWLERIREED